MTWKLSICTPEGGLLKCSYPPTSSIFIGIFHGRSIWGSPRYQQTSNIPGAACGLRRRRVNSLRLSELKSWRVFLWGKNPNPKWMITRGTPMTMEPPIDGFSGVKNCESVNLLSVQKLRMGRRAPSLWRWESSRLITRRPMWSGEADHQNWKW